MIFSILAGLAKFIIGSAVGRIGLAAVAILIAWNVNNYYQQKKGAAKVIEKSIEAGQEKNRVNAKIRKDAKRPGAAERVLRDYCRDCD